MNQSLSQHGDDAASPVPDWNALDRADQQALATLAIFPDEFSREFAGALLSADAAALQRMAGRGILAATGYGRFKIAANLRGQAMTLRLHTPRLAAAAYKNHCVAVCRWLAELGPRLRVDILRAARNSRSAIYLMDLKPQTAKVVAVSPDGATVLVLM